jgi:hypothetical protein
MSYSKFGFSNLVKSNSPLTRQQSPNSYSETITAQVNKVITSDNPDPIVNGGITYSKIGTILCTAITQNVVGSQYIALPKSTSTINIPEINEIVTLHKTLSPNSNGGMWLYDQPHSLYNGSSVNNNKSTPLNTQPNQPNNIKDYKKTELGIPNQQQTLQPPKQETFTEAEINPLTQNSGDIIRYGRHGQSLRFGNNTGNPITILRNGQTKSNEPGFVPISEDIKNDLASLYLTSTQAVKFSLANENFTSYQTPPITPSSFNLPQVILWSDRVVLNAKSDSVLISAAKSVGLSSNESINADSPLVRIHSPNIVLGPSSKDEDIKEPPQPALLGDITIDLIKQLCFSVKSIANLLETSQLFPGGAPVPDAAGNVIGNTASNVVQGILDNLDKTKSKYIKLK